MSGRAVVIGGGVAGLLAAHALAGRGAGVTVIERARWLAAEPEAPPPARRGAPQSHCLHMLMGGGAQAFDRLAPGWRAHVAAQGATDFDALADAAIRLPQGWLPRARSDVRMYACSRALLEDALRATLAARPGVSLRHDCAATGLRVAPGGARVTGVRTAPDAGGDDLPAALVVDASGAASRLPRWLEAAEAGGAGVEETVAASPWRYVSRWFRLAAADAPDWRCLSVSPGPAHPGRAGMMLQAERGFWNVVLLAQSERAAPCDAASFDAFAACLGEGRLARALARAEPASPVHAYGRTANRMRRWDRLARWPQGLVALGDTVMTLDPYFGLGMSAAARGAALLAEALDGVALDALDSRAFQRALTARNLKPWRIATGCEADGAPSPHPDARLGAHFATTHARPAAAKAALRALHLMDRPTPDRKGVAA